MIHKVSGLEKLMVWSLGRKKLQEAATETAGFSVSQTGTFLESYRPVSKPATAT